MHIPDTMITGPICPVTATLAAGGITLAVLSAARSNTQPEPAKFGMVTALIFALQMLNFPVASATSGHLMGGTLAALLLGIPFGILSVSIVVLIQAVVFADGGLTVSGANVLTMAVVGAGAGGGIRLALQNASLPLPEWALDGIAAWSSVMLSAIVCSVFIATGTTTSPMAALFPMMTIHACIGLGEAVITMGVRQASARAAAPLAITGFALLIAPFASAHPDGLERVAHSLHLPEGSLLFAGVLPDYTTPFLPGMLSVMVAGLIGALLCAMVAVTVKKLVTNPLATTGV